MFSIATSAARRRRGAEKKDSADVAAAKRSLKQSRASKRKRKLVLMSDNADKVINDHVSRATLATYPTACITNILAQSYYTIGNYIYIYIYTINS